jgi:WXXGXW repeat (2 copies)
MRLAFMVRFFMFAFVLLAISAAAPAQVRVAITIAPPPLVVYEQPICPGDGYIWTPGFWSYDYDDADYFWVPGTWVEAPEVGFLWTPGYWGWDGGAFIFNEGFWGPEIGFYGGIDYGFGYFGTGYVGGRWDGGHFFYNTTINNVNVNVIHNVYNTRVNVVETNRVSFNGGNGGINARATSEQETIAHGNHMGRVAAQNDHIEAARKDPQQHFGTNHGAPAVAATPRPGAFKESGVVRAGNAGDMNRPAERTENNAARPNPVHPNDLSALQHPAPPNTGNPKTDKKYQQQQDNLLAKQTQERQKLQAQQDKEHQQLEKQKADDARKQQVEQKHAQQTQQMVQRHQQQTQQLQQRQAPPASRPAAPRPH